MRDPEPPHKPAWALGWEAGASTVAEILTDLIADLRKRHSPVPSPGNYVCYSCHYVWPCPTAVYADRADQRLRDMTGDE